jgi:enterochelin esterase-like enzyme
MSRIRFEILPPVRTPDEPVFVSGSLPALGEWDPARALRLDWAAPWHVGSIDVETGTTFEYKVHRGSWQTEAVDAYGNVTANFSHATWLDATRHHTIADWKDMYAGRLMRESLHSRILAGWRDLLLWLPPSYSTDHDRRFPVLVLSDGGNVFDPATSFTGVDWAADEWVTALNSQGAMPEAIVVAVCHPEGYTEENITHRDFDLSPELGGGAYAEFLIQELIPHLDTHYRTLGRPAARMLGGASLGGLMACYVAIHHPGIFGKFACLSTSFEDVSQSLPRNSGQLLALEALPSLPADTKMFFDYGETGLDECYEVYHTELLALLRSRLPHEHFTVRQIHGGTHSELSWRLRLGEALRFLAT